MNRLLKRFVIVSLGLSLLAFPSQAITVQKIANPRQYDNWVTDSANILQPATEAQLNRMIDQLEKENGSEIAVVTIPETKPAASPKAFATELFNYWHIGKKDQDNGILVLISKADRRVEIETGKGLTTILPDAQVVNMINAKMLPRFKQSDFDGGTIAGTQSIISTLAPTLSPDLSSTSSTTASTPKVVAIPAQNQSSQTDNIWVTIRTVLFFLAFPIFLIIMIFGNSLTKKPSSGRCKGRFYDSGSGGSSYSDGGGGGGFGGGDSGGGGGGGSW